MKNMKMNGCEVIACETKCLCKPKPRICAYFQVKFNAKIHYHPHTPRSAPLPSTRRVTDGVGGA